MYSILTWKLIFGMLLVVIIGCGSSDDPLRDEVSAPSTETHVTQFTPIADVTPIVGTWLFESIATLHGDEIVRQESAPSVFRFYLTFKSDGSLKATYNIPIKEFTNAWILAEKGLQHILQHTSDITVTVRGKYEFGLNQIRMTFVSASVTPKEAPQIDSDFENLWFYPFIERVGDTRLFYYIFAEDGSELLFVSKEDRIRGEIFFLRHNTN